MRGRSKMKSRFTRGKEVHVSAESLIRFKLIVRSSCKCCSGRFTPRCPGLAFHGNEARRPSLLRQGSGLNG